MNLPENDSNLENSFLCVDYPKVAVEDNIYIQQCAIDTISPYGIFVWKDKNTSDSEEIKSNCILKTSIAPNSSTVYLQIYNRN